MQTNSRLLALATLSVAIQTCSAAALAGANQVTSGGRVRIRDQPFVTCSFAQLTDVSLVNNIVSDLKAHAGDDLSTDPQQCIHLGCDNGAVVWWCNTDSKTLSFKSGDLADQVSLVVDHCETPEQSDTSKFLVSGSSKSTTDDHYIISVSAGTCSHLKDEQ
ncbi:hypothetical protein PFICI_05150 [Pestalotiopsis fici W106-1]|uniref:Cyanovirin-N domain-containing protein n=1 Tax=Pestalotiopsis fici (strain W106-1 / CGMCC3.15140) TaxID=1229662 RepID=W3XB87_PESFW|nr:uncharacterized protein PFICI_05150 [Pestalotiopsis fici W106-1]ETS83274.1 hypothetical protein PFICI_05150 [Pestalotiopsis fici W106-1]